VAAWQRLNFLTSLTYPQGYSGAYAIPPFVTFTLGNLYKNKSCFIESLSYTVDDNGGWEIGSIGVGEDSSIGINGSTTTMKEYKLPIIVDVAITLKFVESVGTSSTGNFYGFDKLPKKQASGAGVGNAQKLDDANNNEQLATTNDEETNTTINKLKPQKLKSINSPELNSGNTVTTTGETTTSTKASQVNQNESTISQPKPPSYKIEVNDMSDGFNGKVYADGELIKEQEFVSSYAHIGDEGTTKGSAGVKSSLMWEAKYMGFYKNGKKYPPSSNIS
jgi:hypothetical protein